MRDPWLHPRSPLRQIISHARQPSQHVAYLLGVAAGTKERTHLPPPHIAWHTPHWNAILPLSHFERGGRGVRVFRRLEGLSAYRTKILSAPEPPKPGQEAVIAKLRARKADLG